MERDMYKKSGTGTPGSQQEYATPTHDYAHTNPGTVVTSSFWLWYVRCDAMPLLYALPTLLNSRPTSASCPPLDGRFVGRALGSEEL